MNTISKSQVFAAVLWATTLTGNDAIAGVVTTAAKTESPGAATEETAIRRLLTQFRDVRISMSEAMAMAERLHEGSRTADISFEASGSLVYRVRTVKNECVWENVVDATTGTFNGKETASSLKELDRADLANFVALKWIKQDLSDAVRVAEKAAAGRALAGGLLKQDGTFNFVVVIASGEHLKEVLLEPPKVGREKLAR